MPSSEHDPYDDLYNDNPSPAGEAKSESAADKQSQPVQTEEAARSAAGENGDQKAPPAEEQTDQKQTAPGESKTAQAHDEPAQSDQPTLKQAEDQPKSRALADYDPYDDLYNDVPSAPAITESEDTEGENQDNFVESKEPSELLMCLILASAYLGLAKYCWTPLLLAKDWKLLFNIEGFFLSIAVVAILIGLRPYISPSALQVSKHGIKYRGPYWPQRKTVNWSQVTKLYLSPELIVLLYKPKLGSRSLIKINLLPMFIPIVYLSDRERIAKVFIKYSPIYPVILSSPAILSRIVMLLAILGVIIWVLELLIH